MTENDYLHAWAIYAVAALGCLLVWFRITRWMWRFLREPLRVIGLVALVAPTLIDPAQEKYAPAVAVTALDLVFKVGNNAWRSISELLMYSMIALGIYLVFALIRWPFLRKANERRAAQAQAAAAAAAAPAPQPEVEEPFGAAGRPHYSADPVPRSAPRNPPAAGPRGRVEPRL
ncbi:MFS transporter [Pseudomonas sp. HR96]|uniref:MFS transporter n=1 Tax=Pseudomonas sp. HR96 TaxID=1027966 RepID=UPI002A765016|nr:MFS transporter [Pseudomonas sp. HR96]WPP01088.1 MFS transporter [Pseudomonas sp. HR96]